MSSEMLTFEELKEEAEEKGYLLKKLDRGPRHRAIRNVSDRHEIWLTGNYEGPYIKGEPTWNFSSKIGIGSTLDEALEEAQRDLAKRPSHAS